MVLLEALALSVVAAWPGLSADWPEILGPRRDGISSEVNLALNWSKEGPPLVWEKSIGSGFSGPVVSGGRLLLFHRVDNQEIVACFDAASGKERWKFEYPTAYRDDFGFDDGPRATPVISGKRIYTLGAEGTLHCVDLESGNKVWGRSINEEYRVRKGFFGVGSSPIVEGNLLIVNVGGKDMGAGIVAFDKNTGKEIWRATNHEASYSSPVAATIEGVRHVFFFTREGLVSVDPAAGAVRFSKRWRARISASVNAASPVVVGNLVFISTCYDTGALLIRVKKDGFDEIWNSDEVLSNHYATSVHHKGYLYGIDGRQEYGARLRCVELQTGKVQWTRERFGCASLILAGSHLIALTEKGELVSVEATPEAYREKARASVLPTKECRAPIALADGRLYARDGKRLICLSLKT